MSKIILNKLIVQGNNYRRTIYFEKKFTIISGDKTSGKSLILSLVDYCMGRSKKIDLNVQTELAENCDQVFLEMEINNETITINRSLKKNISSLRIYFCEFLKLEEFTPKTLHIKEAMTVLMNIMQINEHKLIRHKKNSSEKEIDKISFRDIYRYVYVNQHQLGTDNFLSNLDNFKARKNKYAFEIIFDLIESDKESLKEKLVEVQNKIERISKELYGLHAYIKDLGEIEKNILHSKINKINEDINKFETEKKEILKNNEVNNNNNKENIMYIKLKDKINELVNDISEYETKKRSLLLSMNSKNLLIKDYELELDNVLQTIEINYKLEITNQTIECPLCNSNLENIVHKHESEKTSSETLLKNLKKQLENKINLVKGIIKKESLEVAEIDLKKNLLIENKSVFEKAIISYSKETKVPYLSQIESINSLINTKLNEREHLREGLKIFNKISEKETEIKALSVIEEDLKEKLKALDVDTDVKEEIFNYLNNEYRNYMRRFKYEVTKEDTYIHQEKMIPYYKGASVYKHESGGLLECMQLSYLCAILKSKKEGYGQGHPGLLMLDSLSKYVGTLNKYKDVSNENTLEFDEIEKERQRITDPEVYNEFYKILIELSEDFQIILVENTPPAEYDKKYSKYTLFTGNRGLIDLEKNELN